MFVSGVAQQLLGGNKGRIIVCHLGNGASVSAVKDGKCIDTSMGLTPLEGLLMGTRCGDLDPAVLEYLSDKKGMDIHQITTYLNKKSGVLGISGVSSDFRDLLAGIEQGNDRCRLALDMFSYRVLKYVGSYVSALGGLDLIAFTGGIGEHTPEVRSAVLDSLAYMGVKYDKAKNLNPGRGDTVKLSTEDSSAKAYIIPTNEELVIARETLALIK